VLLREGGGFRYVGVDPGAAWRLDIHMGGAVEDLEDASVRIRWALGAVGVSSSTPVRVLGVADWLVGWRRELRDRIATITAGVTTAASGPRWWGPFEIAWTVHNGLRNPLLTSATVESLGVLAPDPGPWVHVTARRAALGAAAGDTLDDATDLRLTFERVGRIGIDPRVQRGRIATAAHRILDHPIVDVGGRAAPFVGLIADVNALQSGSAYDGVRGVVDTTVTAASVASGIGTVVGIGFTLSPAGWTVIAVAGVATATWSVGNLIYDHRHAIANGVADVPDVLGDAAAWSADAVWDGVTGMVDHQVASVSELVELVEFVNPFDRSA
jgi:hypothetical protein